MLSHRCSGWSLLYLQHVFREPKLGPPLCPLALGGDPGAHPSICIVLSPCFSGARARSPLRPGDMQRCAHSTSPSLRDFWGRQSRREARFHLFHPHGKAQGMGTQGELPSPALSPCLHPGQKRQTRSANAASAPGGERLLLRPGPSPAPRCSPASPSGGEGIAWGGFMHGPVGAQGTLAQSARSFCTLRRRGNSELCSLTPSEQV